MSDRTTDRPNRGERLTLSLQSEGTALVVTLFGELDLAAAPLLTESLPDPSDAPVVVLDFARVSFLDAGGLRHLLALVEEGRSATLRHPSRLVRRILDVTGTAERFRVDPPMPV